MRIVITNKDVQDLTGKFIIELDDEHEDTFELTDKNWNFYKEKRISFVSGIKWLGFYYEHNNIKSVEDFVENFNPRNNRFRRFLTSKELDFVLNKMKQELY